MKVGFFLGRNHHALKLMPIASGGYNLGVFDSEFIISDNAINIDPATEFLKKHGVNSFIHVKDYISEVNDDNVISLLRPLLSKKIAQSVPAFWLSFSAREILENVNGFSNYLATSDVDAIFVLHTQNFWAKMFTFLAMKENKKVYSLQEGIILESEEADMGKYSGAINYVSTLFSWSENSRKYYSSPDKVVPVGPIHMDYWIRVANTSEQAQVRSHVLNSAGLNERAKTVMFAPPSLSIYLGDFVDDLREIAKHCVRNNINVIVRLHPFQGKVQEIDNLVERYSNLQMYIDDNPMPAILSSDLVITQMSTISIESLILGIPVAEIDTKNYGVEQSLSKYGVASKMNSASDISKLLEYENKDAIEKFIREEIPLADGNSVNRVIEYISE
jgi:hypothetical protein